MRVAELVKPYSIVITEKETPSEIGKEEVLIKVKVVGICGTDLHVFAGHRNDIAFPRIMGHEFSGIVEKIGENIKHVKIGDKVVVDPVVSCGICKTCLSGHENVCNNVACLGVQVDGAFSDYFVSNGKRVYKIDDNLSYETAATIEPYSVASNVLSKVNIKKGDNCIVFGSGPIGLVITQALKGFGANVMLIDIVDERLAMAKEFGADYTINSNNEDVKLYVEEKYGYGADIIIDAVGMAKIMDMAVELAAPVATILCLGFDGNATNIKPVDITKKELAIIGSRMNCNRFENVIEWFENGFVNPEKLISKVYSFENIEQAFNDTLENSTKLLKVLIKL